MFQREKPWEATELAAHLRDAGIAAGTNVILHSSLRSVGPTVAGPETVLHAFLDTIGPTGNLLVPTFTYSLPGWKHPPFNVETLPARTGAIPEYIRHRPNAQRSFHPTHSVAVIGPDALSLTENHLDFTPLGEGSPYHRMWQAGATIVMLGTRQDTNSTLHLCEVMAKLPYVDVPFADNINYEIAWYETSDGKVEFTPIREVPGCSRGFRAVEPELIRRGVLRQVTIGNAVTQILDMRQLVETMIDVLRVDPTILLCHLKHCAICPKRRRAMRPDQ